MLDYDIAVIGAGPVGLAFAQALRGSGLSVGLFERAPEASIANPAFDGREIALTHHSQKLMAALGAGAALEHGSPLREAVVLNGRSPFALEFTADGPKAGPLGLLVPNHEIRRALHDAVRADASAEIHAGAEVTDVSTDPREGRLTLADGRMVRARLVVAADTRFSDSRRRVGIRDSRLDFGSTMLVARVAHEKPHHGIATEWFGHGQTVAMLPLAGNVSSFVLTLKTPHMARLMEASPEDFAAEATRRTEGRWGRMALVATRHAYPLVAVYARRFVGRRFALLGDAAVGMHPVTAHGFNFGLAGAERLARELGDDPGETAALLRFESRHRRGTFPLFTATNAIAKLYTDDRPPARLLRGAVMRLGGALAPLRRAVAAQLMDAR
jgi:ubiquinone biosynthesis UbiH/UbiF/VisC/COQ6 family hydroxylase